MDCSDKVNALATPSMTAHINFYENEKMSFVLQGKTVVDRKGTFHGLVGFHRIGLSDSIGISTSFEEPLTTWSQNFFPLENGVAVQEGDEVSFKVIPILHRGSFFWQWETSVCRNGDEIAKFSQTDFSVKKEEFLIRQEGFRPILSRRGEIERKGLNLCDGTRAMGEIAESIKAEYPGEYKSIEEAFETVMGILRGKVNVN